MTGPLTQLKALRRPQLLINAANLGLSDYCRETHLARHLGVNAPQSTAAALRQLMELEHQLDQDRRMRKASYSISQHVELVIAIINEARQLRLQSDIQPSALTLP